MEIPSHIQSLLNKLASSSARGSANTSSNQTMATSGNDKLLELGNLKAGTQLQAQVASIKALTTAEKATLFDFLKNAPSPNSSNTNSANNATTPSGAALTGGDKSRLDQLLQKPELYLVKLNLQGKLLSTISDVSLQTKQWVSVAVRADGQLQLYAKNASAKQAINNTESTNAQALANNKPSQPLTTSQLNTAESLRGRLLQQYQQPQLMNVLTGGLRRYMPLEKPLAETFNSLHSLAQALQKGQKVDLPFSSTNPYVGKPTSTATNISQLTALLNKAVDMELAAVAKQPDIIKQSIARSGLSLEAKLRAAASALKQLNVQTSSTTQRNPADVVKANLSPPLSPEESAKLQQTQTQILRENAVPYDLKTALLQILESPLASKIQSQNPEQFNRLLQVLLPGLTQQQLANLPKAELEQRIQNVIRQWVMSGIARITGLQLRHLINTVQDSSVSGAGGMYELPLRIGDNFYPVVLHIQEKYHREKEQEDDQQDNKSPQKAKLKSSWQVYLEFDLDEYGLFASEITLVDSNIKTQFWVQQSPLWSKSREHLNELRQALEDAGINVDEMHCAQGTPPEKNMNLQHALVDIRT